MEYLKIKVLSDIKRREIFYEREKSNSMKGKLFTNQKEINRAIRAAVNQFKIFLKYKYKKK